MTSLPARKNNLLIVARTARALAQMAREAGYAPYVIDLFGDEDTRRAACATTALTPNRHFDFDAGELLGAIAAHQSLRGAMPIVCGSAFERAPTALASMGRHYRVLGCDAAVYRQLHSLPALFAELRKEAGIATPATRWRAPSVVRNWLRKDVGGSGGNHVRSVTALAHAGRGHYFQARVAGVSRSALFIANARECRYHGCAEHLRWHDARGYRYEGARHLKQVPASLRARLETIGAVLTRRLGLRGCFGIDFLWRDGADLDVLDINPRPTATLELWPERHRMFSAHVAACTAETLLYSSPQADIERAHLVLYADARWQVDAGLAWPRWIADRPMAGSIIGRGAPLCTLQGEGRDWATLKDNLLARYAELRRLIGVGASALLPATINIRTM